MWSFVLSNISSSVGLDIHSLFCTSYQVRIFVVRSEVTHAKTLQPFLYHEGIGCASWRTRWPRAVSWRTRTASRGTIPTTAGRRWKSCHKFNIKFQTYREMQLNLMSENEVFHVLFVPYWKKQGVPCPRRPGLGWLRFEEFPGWWVATVATYCPSRVVENSKSKSTKPSPRGHGTPCILRDVYLWVVSVLLHRLTNKSTLLSCDLVEQIRNLVLSVIPFFCSETWSKDGGWGRSGGIIQLYRGHGRRSQRHNGRNLISSMSSSALWF